MVEGDAGVLGFGEGAEDDAEDVVDKMERCDCSFSIG